MLLHDLLAQWIAKYRLKYTDQAELPQWFYHSVKERIIASLKLLTKEDGELISCKNPRGDGKVHLEITSDMCDQAFETGFKHVKAMIQSQLKELAGIKKELEVGDHIVTTIVSDGSSLHPEFIKWIKAICMNLELPEPLFTQNMEIHYG